VGVRIGTDLQEGRLRNCHNVRRPIDKSTRIGYFRIWFENLRFINESYTKS
jgi:hypothetical protein